MEALVGDIRAPGMPDEPMAVRREDGSWLLDGRLSVRELRGLLGLRELPGEGAMGVDTLGGLVMATLSRIPSKGDDFEYAKWRFEVVDMDGKRVDQVLVTPLPPQAPPNAI
jgi:putative hemolysin